MIKNMVSGLVRSPERKLQRENELSILSRPSFSDIAFWIDWTDPALVYKTTNTVPPVHGEPIGRTYFVGSSSFITVTAGRAPVYYKTSGDGTYVRFDGVDDYLARAPLAQVDPPYTVCMAVGGYHAGTGTGNSTLFTHNGISFRRNNSTASGANYQIGSATFGTISTDAYREGKVSIIAHYNLASSFIRSNGSTYAATVSGNRSFLTASNIVFGASDSTANFSYVNFYSLLLVARLMTENEMLAWEAWASQQMNA